ncbi:MAG: tyrosine-type recombinase/integrase [Streptosporangiaceae bacterium]
MQVRYGKASRGGPPRRRTVLTVPEFDWVTGVLGHWAEEVRPLLAPGQHPALWVTERRGRIAVDHLDHMFTRIREDAGLAEELDLHSLRHSYVTHLLEFGYPPLFVQLLLSRREGVHDVQHEPGACGNLRAGGGYLRSSVTQIPRRFDACAAGADARLVG